MMKAKWSISAIFAIFLVQISWNTFAFECPKHFAEAQATIDKITEDMKGMEKTMSKEEMALVHALVDDAKMLLAGAKHNHEKPQGAYDHARAIAKADAARGYATAADMLHVRYMKK